MFPSLEAIVWKCFVKKVFLKISQDSLENTCARGSFLNKVAGLANFAKFLRAPIFIEHLWWLFLHFLVPNKR